MQSLVGRTLVRVSFGTGVRLDFDGTHSPELTVECPLRITSDRPWTGEPVSAGAADRLLPLLFSAVRSADIDSAGGLTIAVGSVQIHVSADDSYEAWQLRRDDGMLVVSMPGGDLAVWTATAT